MKREMNKWLDEIIASPVKNPLPVLSFPAIQVMGITVKDLINSPENQAKAMKIIAERTPVPASVSLMDLSVEAEAFGSQIRYSDDEVPTVIGSIVHSMEEAEALAVPAVGAGRTGVCVKAIEQAVNEITDRPVLAGVIGPFSLAGRLLDVSEAMVLCYEEPEIVEEVLNKCTEFLINYCQAFKDVGANGVVMAEPLAGLLSAALSEEFSETYVKRVVDAVQDDNFIVVYHNCGNNAIGMIDSILRTGSRMLHFGNAIKMADMMPHIPANVIAMGNVDPAGQFRNGTPESIANVTREVLEQCSKYPNFVISSGCDIPPMSPWENIDAFFRTVDEFYSK